VNRPQLCRRPDIFTSETRVVTHRISQILWSSRPAGIGGLLRRPAGTGRPRRSSRRLEGQRTRQGVMGKRARPMRNRGWHARRPAFPRHGQAPHPILLLYALPLPRQKHCSGVSARRAKRGGENPPYRSHCPCPAGHATAWEWEHDATRRNGIKGEPNRTAGGRRPEPRQAATAQPAHRNRDRAGEAAGETEEGTRARGSCNGSMKLAQHGAAGSARTVRAYYQCHRLLSES
jgi:hypothetical protein